MSPIADHPLPPYSQVWVAAAALIAEQGKVFFSCWRKAAASFGADEIHDLRVASRRVREGLALFAPFFPEDELSFLSKKVKKLTRILGAVRNTDEALVFFSSLPDPDPDLDDCRTAVQSLILELGKERDQRQRELKKRLRKLAPSPLRQGFRSMRRHARLFGRTSVDPFAPFSDFAGEAIKEREQTVAELLPLAVRESEHEAQHRLRIAVKHLRYRLEILQTLFPAEFPALQQSLKSYQDLLGKLHDMDVFAEVVKEKVDEGTDREQILAIVAKRRKALHAEFLAQLKKDPLKAIGKKARKAL